MNMKGHILAALREQFEHWEELLASLSEEQITAARFDLDWSIQDMIAHLWARQQISIARMEGGVHDRAPEYPQWITDIGEEWEEDADQTNEQQITETHKIDFGCETEHRHCPKQDGCSRKRRDN